VIKNRRTSWRKRDRDTEKDRKTEIQKDRRQKRVREEKRATKSRKQERDEYAIHSVRLDNVGAERKAVAWLVVLAGEG